jgi:hypothetical protein
MTRPSASLYALTIITALAALSHPGSLPALHWNTISHSKLCVTEGVIGENADHRLTVDVTKMRAFVTVATSQDIAARFTYRGGSKTETPLGSGAIRRQFGFKLHAQDPCNLVYAMWRIAPKDELVVSVKSNPGLKTSAECGNRGYKDIKPARSSPVPAMPVGSTHSLRAEMTDEELGVYADDKLVWEGAVGPLAMRFHGPVGIRSDNVNLEFELRAGQTGENHPEFELACKPGPGESE